MFLLDQPNTCTIWVAHYHGLLYIKFFSEEEQKPPFYFLDMPDTQGWLIVGPTKIAECDMIYVRPYSSRIF